LQDHAICVLDLPIRVEGCHGGSIDVDV
jgi:hypothetical protein